MAKVLRKRVFECGDGSAARVTFSPWTTHEQSGFRAEVGSHFLWILSFGETKESISPTAKTLGVLVYDPEACFYNSNRLNYRSLICRHKKTSISWLIYMKMAERTGLEPAPPGVTGRLDFYNSNRLNYRSLICRHKKTSISWLI
ncbi:hypothetical protein, partial [Alishewanella sp. SMS8]|uniref:hypothetical protein n=1 Tax=Alishewanella sp. SMS8 TaxID=2994676 RepID=UPI0027414915